jgi:plastocyanin
MLSDVIKRRNCGAVLKLGSLAPVKPPNCDILRPAFQPSNPFCRRYLPATIAASSLEPAPRFFNGARSRRWKAQNGLTVIACSFAASRARRVVFLGLNAIRRNTLNRKTIIATVALFVMAVALTALTSAAAQDCCKGAQDCCKPARDCCNPPQDCCKNAHDCCNPPQDCCAAMRQSVVGAEPVLQNGAQTATVEVNSNGFGPSILKLKAGVPAKVTFVRKTDETCAKEVVIKEYNIDRKLPLNEPVTVEFTPRKGEFTFACGMDMIKGKLIVE